MDLFGITDYFDAFISGSECENGKPDPEIFLKGSRGTWTRNQQECIVVEDSDSRSSCSKKCQVCIALDMHQKMQPKQDIQ